nr:reverse transcriptase domain-containing protein [Tanacetum cinerariifolium]
MNIPISFPAISSEDVSEEPLIVEAEVEGYLVRRVYVDEGSSVEVMFEHYFENLNPKIKDRLRETQTDLVGFAEEVSKLLGKIELETIRKKQMIEGGRPEEKGEVAATEEVLINPSFLDQLVTIGGGLSEMVKEDEEKTAFSTDQGTYCYTKMPFGLKNAGATYQRLVDSAFHSQIGRNLEAYVYDMYVSRTLNEAEITYAPMEKLALSLIHMTRRLRRYFEAHPVKVIIDQPIKNILNNTETSRKLAKYAVELGAYNIMFIPRNAVKGQVLADFLSEAPKGTKEDLYFRMPEVTVEKYEVERWTLFTDEASSPKGQEQAEYKALLAGLRIAQKMNISNIEVKVDSKLVASQINRTYEASKDSMIKYLAKAREYVSRFKSFSIENIPRNMNQKADVLSKPAYVAFNHLTKEVLVEILNERSTEKQEVHTIVEEEGNNWMTPIIQRLGEGTSPKDKNKARCLRAKIGQYTIESGVLFKKGYLVPMLRCVGSLHANYVMCTIHMGSCGMHVGPRAVVRKAVRQGYYWPTMHEDAKKEVEKCDHAKYTLRFGLPRVIVTDNGAQLVNDPFKSWCGREEKAGWVDELPNVIWAHRTSIKQRNGETPFSLTYGSEAVISVEIGIPSYQTLMFREGYNEEEMCLNLDLLQEMREAAAIREAKYKTKMEQYYNKKVRPAGFRPREFVFQRNEASGNKDQGKLGPKWEGPYKVVEAYENGSYKL